MKISQVASMAGGYLRIYNLAVALALSVVNGFSGGFVFYHHRQDCYVNISTLVCGSVPLGYKLRRGTAGSKDMYTLVLPR